MKRQRKKVKRDTAAVGILELLSNKPIGVDDVREEIDKMIATICQIARKHDVPHEVFEAVYSLQERADPFMWYEKRPTVQTVSYPYPKRRHKK